MTRKYLIWTALGFALALVLALCSAHWYETPELGTSNHPFWEDSDFLLAFASGAVAAALGLATARVATGAGALGSGSLFLRALIASGLTLLLLALWAPSVSLLALLIAPSHAFVGLRLVGLWTRWRAEVSLRN